MHLWSGRPLWRCFESIWGHFQTQRCRRAVDHSYRISGEQKQVLSLVSWTVHAMTLMNASLERSTAPKQSSAHSGALQDTETQRDNVERSTARIVS